MKFNINLAVLLTLYLVAVFNVRAEEDKKYLIMKLADSNNEICFPVDAKTDISFNGQSVIINYYDSGNEKKHISNILEVDNFHFERRTSSIHNIKLKQQVEIKWIDSNNIILSTGNENLFPIIFFNDKGYRINCDYSMLTEHSCTVNLSSLQKGIIIIKLNDNSSIKLLKK